MALTRTKKCLLAGTSLAVIAAGAVLLPPLLLKPLINQTLRSKGFPDARVSSISFTPRGLYIDHIALDADDFSTIDDVTVECNWRDVLLHQTVQSLQIKTISLAADLDKDGHIKIAGWNAQLPDTSSKTLLPIPRITLQGIILDLTTPQGDIRIEGKLALNTPSADKQIVQYSIWGQQRQLSFDANGTLTLSANGDRVNTLTLNDGRANIPPFEATRLSGYWEDHHQNNQTFYVGRVVAGQIKVIDTALQNIDLKWDSREAEAMKWSLSPTGHPDITLKGRWLTQPHSKIQATLTTPDIHTLISLLPADQQEPLSSSLDWIKPRTALKAELESDWQKLIRSPREVNIATQIGTEETGIHLSGRARSDEANGTLTLIIDPTLIAAERLKNILTLDKKWSLENMGGDVAIAATTTLPMNDAAPALSGYARLTLKKINAKWNSLLLSNFDADLKIGSLSPLHFDGLHKIALTLRTKTNSQKQPLPEAHISGVLEHTKDNNLAIKSLQAKIDGGTLTLDPFIYPLNTQAAPQPAQTLLTLDRVSIESLLPLLDIDGLNGSGLFSGSFPLTITPKSVTIGKATLASVENGVFSFNPTTYPTSLQGDDTRMVTVREALKDFRYSSLSLAIKGDINGDMSSQLRAEGTNPVFGTRPIHLNLNLDGNIAGALDKLSGKSTWTNKDIQDKLKGK